MIADAGLPSFLSADPSIESRRRIERKDETKATRDKDRDLGTEFSETDIESN